MSFCLTSASSVGRFRIAAKKRLFWNLLNFSESEGGLNISLILFFIFSLSFIWCTQWQSPSETLASQQKQRFGLSAPLQDTNSNMYLLRGLGQGRLAGPVTAKAICQACNGLRLQQPHLCNNLSPLGVPWERSCAVQTAQLNLDLACTGRTETLQGRQSRTRALAEHKHFLESGLPTHAHPSVWKAGLGVQSTWKHPYPFSHTLNTVSYFHSCFFIFFPITPLSVTSAFFVPFLQDLMLHTWRRKAAVLSVAFLICC